MKEQFESAIKLNLDIMSAIVEDFTNKDLLQELLNRGTSEYSYLKKEIQLSSGCLICEGKDVEGGEIDALIDAVFMIDDLLNDIFSLVDQDKIRKEYSTYEQSILLDPADYDHLPGAWKCLQYKDSSGITPIKQLLTKEFQLIKQNL